jgi:hypothetical protein
MFETCQKGKQFRRICNHSCKAWRIYVEVNKSYLPYCRYCPEAQVRADFYISIRHREASLLQSQASLYHNLQESNTDKPSEHLTEQGTRENAE